MKLPRVPNQKDIDEQAAVFSALSDPTRLKLVNLLCRQRDPDALCVNALADLLGVSQSAVSQHLRVLKAIGLVNGERRGYHIHYYVNYDMVKRCRELILSALTIEEPVQRESCQVYCPNKGKLTEKKRKHKSPNLD
jgi:ArsR family transcriptional regulator